METGRRAKTLPVPCSGHKLKRVIFPIYSRGMYCSADLFVILAFRNINTAELGLGVPGHTTNHTSLGIPRQTNKKGLRFLKPEP
jgi:hypothetical protein